MVFANEVSSHVKAALILVFCTLFIVGNTNCYSDEGDDTPYVPPTETRSISVHVDTNGNCTQPGTFNYNGSDVYDERLDDMIGEPTLQLGGHPIDDSKDLAINLVSYGSPLTSGVYPLQNDPKRQSWVIYRPTNSSDSEYVSYDRGLITLEEIEFHSNDKVRKAYLRFDTVKVVNKLDTICISGRISIEPPQ